MSSQLTPSGIPSVGALPWGSHFCQFYDGPSDMADTLVPYFKAGLEQNELCHWVTSEQFDRDAATSSLRAAYPDLDRALQSGQITIVDRREWYQRSGEFKAEEVVAGWLQREESSRTQGYDGYRLTGDTLWLEPHSWAAFMEYEELVSRAFAGRRLVAFCTYCMGKCGAHEVLDVVRNHAFAVARRGGEWNVIETADSKFTKEELAALNADLERRVDAATSDLRVALAHKESLLQEVHHRVKNNLQIVSSLLLLKGRSSTDEARRVLSETSDRVRSIAAVHEALYGGLEGDRISLKERLGVIAGSLADSYDVANRIAISVEGDEVRLPLETAVPAALVATEGLANALKHAFPGERSGRVDVHLSERPHGFTLVVEDDGVGWSPEAAGRGSGLDIVLALARQLDGQIVLEPRVAGGTRFALQVGD